MRRTTIYLPDDLKRALEELSARRGCTEAQLIREAVATLTAGAAPPAPRLPLFSSSQPALAEDIDEALRGFGDR